jgi:hypothetical protein
LSCFPTIGTVVAKLGQLDIDTPMRCWIVMPRVAEKLFSAACVLAVFMVVLSSRAVEAEVHIAVDKSTQRMSVSVNGTHRYSWAVSTGMAGYGTPTGAFAASRMEKEHYSKEWDDAPMPHSIFFTDAGHAIHGSHAVTKLGTPASHGCVRLAPANARTLFNLVKAEGLATTRVEVTGVDPNGESFAGGYGSGRDFRGLTSFDPLTTGIMAGYGSRQRGVGRKGP